METDIKNDGNMLIGFTALKLNTVPNTNRNNQSRNNHHIGGYEVVTDSKNK